MMMFKQRFSLIMAASILAISSFQALAEVNVKDAWVRLLPPMSKMTAAYMTIQSDQDDRLLSASSNIANVIEIHQSKMKNGVMSMQQIDGLALPKDTLVELKPQSYHLMVMGLVKPLNASEEHSFTLEFEKAGKIDILVPVKQP